jgi:LysM repeat protein
MANQSKQDKGQSRSKPKQSPKSVPETSPLADQALPEEQWLQLAAVPRIDSVRQHAALLRDRRYQGIQRQLMVRRIGRRMGNQYLQRVLLQMKADEGGHQPQGLNSLSSGPAQISRTTLADGQIQQTIRVPITGVISREEEPGGGETEPPIHVAEIPSDEEQVDELDFDNTISASGVYLTSVSQGGSGPSGYGVTRSSAAWKNIDIESSIGTIVNSGTYTVSADFEYTVQWQVRTGVGPSSEVDIAGDTDSDIKATNYQYVAKDLTPNMGDLNGRPPRRGYWAEDLTRRHELFHARERSTFGRDGATAAKAWLNSQTATSANQVKNTLLPQALTEGVRAINTKMALPPGKEERAYGDGVASYQARATGIKAKGDAGSYGKVSTSVKVLPKGGGTYEVVSGDTLWAIAERTYGHGKYWREIHKANPGKARDGGNAIFPGQVFDLPELNFDQELYVSLSSDTSTVMTENVVVSGGGSHEFLTAAKDIFSDDTNNDGTVAVEVYDAEGNTLVSMNWSVPTETTSISGGYEVTAKIAL